MIISMRRGIFYQYMEMLKPLEDEGWLKLPLVDDESVNNGHIFYVITASLDERNRIIAHLKASGIMAIFHYVPLHSSPAGKKYGRVSGSMRQTDDLSDRILRLPLYYGMSEENVHHVAGEIREFFQR